jgi:hypothetical protein
VALLLLPCCKQLEPFLPFTLQVKSDLSSFFFPDLIITHPSDKFDLVLANYVVLIL